MNLQQKIAIVIVDIIIVVELCISMFLAAKNADTLTPVFMKSFFAMLAPTLILAGVAVKKLRTEHA